MLAELGLVAVAGSQVGGSSGIRGVSGGERRRVTIGMELVIDPSILVLDEPTSGLDSYTAVNLMQTLKQARTRTIPFSAPVPCSRLLVQRSSLSSRAWARSPEECSYIGHLRSASPHSEGLMGLSATGLRARAGGAGGAAL